VSGGYEEIPLEKSNSLCGEGGEETGRILLVSEKKAQTKAVDRGVHGELDLCKNNISEGEYS